MQTPNGPHSDLVLDDVLVSGDTGPATVSVGNDYEDDSFAPWVQNGSPTGLAVIADTLDGTNKVLSITGRAAGHDGVSLDLLGTWVPGDTVTITAQVRVAAAAAASEVNFAVERVVDGTTGWDWIGGPVAITDAGYTTVGGTYVIPAGATAAKLYVQTPNGPHSDLILDDVLVSGATGGSGDDWTPDLTDFVPGGAAGATTTPVSAARGDGNVAALTFDDGPNGAHTERLLDFLAAEDIKAVFCVIGDNIQAAGGAAVLQRIVSEGHVLCNHTTGYDLVDGMTKAQVETELKANLAIIRSALGDPTYPVPYYRAPNGAWGQSAEVAVALGMQPLAVTNTIEDWATQDADTLATNLHAAMKPGEIVLAHDGGGDRTGTIDAVIEVVTERLADGWTFTLPEGGLPEGLSMTFDFEDGLQGWVARDSQGEPVITWNDADAHGGEYSALVSDRSGQGDGLLYDFSGLMETGVEYEISAWLKLYPGENADDIVLSIQTAESGDGAFSNIDRVTGVTDGEWVELRTSYTFSGTDMARIYFETPWVSADDPGTTTSFMVDDVSIASVDATQIEDLPSIFEAYADEFPVGVAIDSRETLGSPGELTLRHFNQVTAENHMKVESWYDEDRNFRMHPQAIAIMDFARDNDLRVYGHVLLWHSQTPAWFFQDDEGQQLTNSPEDQAFLAQRLETHIDNVADAIVDRYGPFGSDTNPLIAWDVVNEVVNDQPNAATNGLRNSPWYQIMGEDYIDLAFELANEAFNGTYAADDADHPVTLFINDYNTEQSGKQNRYYDLVNRLLDRNVPIDGVGHQFHVSLSMPVENLGAALDRFADLPLVQAVTELDVTVGGNPTEALLVEQGYYYRDAFRYFRQHAEDMFSVTIWGLTDTRSWRSEQAPLVFTGSLRAKPAYHGIMDADLPPLIRTANVFAGDVALGAAAVTSPEWSRLPLLPLGDSGDFALRWAADHLTAYVSVDDATNDGAGDVLEFEYADDTLTFARNGTGDVSGTVVERTGGYDVVVHLPGTFTQGQTLGLDVRATDGSTQAEDGWNTPGVLGTLTLVEALSYTAVAEAPTAPTIDGAIDDVWALSEVLTTGKRVSGTSDGAATAEVRTLWSGDGTTLYVLMDVTDPERLATASDPWEQDSVEIYIDRGNYKNGSYRYDDNQIRIDFEGEISFGTGDEAFQADQVDYDVALTDGGYVVEAAINLLEYGGPGSFHGVDFQVNDATQTTRNIHNWADPTGLGYQSTAHWGVAELVAADPGDPGEDGPAVTLGVDQVKAGGSVAVELAGFAPGETVELYLSTTGLAALGGGLAAAPGDTLLGTAVMDAEGAASGSVTIPAGTTPGAYFVNVETDGAVAASAPLRVLAADPAAPGGGTGGNLPRTGSDALGMLLTALLLVGAGAGLLAARRPSRRGAMA